MKDLRNQTYKDLHAFVAKREKIPWRNWDKYRCVSGFEKDDYKSLRERLEIDLGIFRRIEHKESSQEEDLGYLEKINREMVDFVV